jgi:hypothetical protein
MFSYSVGYTVNYEKMYFDTLLIMRNAASS